MVVMFAWKRGHKASLLNMASSINLSENDIPGASLFGQKLKNEELKFLCFALVPASPYGLAFMQHLLRQPLWKWCIACAT